MKSYLHAVAMIFAVMTGLGGLFWLQAAASLEQYLGAAVLIGAAAIAVFVAHKLDAGRTESDLRSLADYLGKPDPQPPGAKKQGRSDPR